jgi:hypothetical protein
MPASAPPRPRTRRPTGLPSWPLILVAGEGKTGKTYAAAEFTADERVGESFMLDLGEGSGDEYIGVPGARYELIEHDGTWISIITEVEAVRDYARAQLAAGAKPVCLIIDSMTAEWGMLSAWTDTRARRSKTNKKLLAEDPDAEIEVGHMYWNDANSRHNRLINICKTFPGIVILTAQETEKSQFGPDGRPLKINGQPAPKVARPDAHKRLPADVTAWIRLSHEHPPVIVGLRSLKHNIQPGKTKPEAWPDFSIARLVFDYMGLTADRVQVRDVPALNADQVDPREQPHGEQAPAAPTEDQLAQRRRLARETVAHALAADNVDEAAKRATVLMSHRAKDSDILYVLSQDERDLLGIGPDVDRLTLAELGPKIVDYVGAHKCSVLTPVEDTPVPPVVIPAADGEYLRDRHSGDLVPRAEVEAIAREFHPMRMAQES